MSENVSSTLLLFKFQKSLFLYTFKIGKCPERKTLERSIDEEIDYAINSHFVLILQKLLANGEKEI